MRVLAKINNHSPVFALKFGRQRKSSRETIAIVGIAAALGSGEGIVVNAGSGSSVTGRRGDRIEKAGGWGHILGDAGGGYFIVIQALRLILREYDLRRGEGNSLRKFCKHFR